MSTPSTQTAVLPLSHYHYSRHHSHQQQLANSQTMKYNSVINKSNYNPLPIPKSDKRLLDSSSIISRPNTRQASRQRYDDAQPVPASPSNNSYYTPEAMSTSSRTRKASTVRKKVNKRPPDWDDFYRNGIPQEVIVIDDDSPQPGLRGSKIDLTVNERPDKKRKIAQPSTYDPIYKSQASYSTSTSTPYYDNSSTNHTVSTDRTASLYTQHTTSSSSDPTLTNGSYYSQYDDGAVGQKRKRTSRAVEQFRDENGRGYVGRVLSPYSAYVPPPNPPFKAREIVVRVIRDPTGAKDPKVFDDEDGHYSIEVGSDLTPRYEIMKLLGQGTFGKVVEAYDRETNTKCAIKVIRSVQKYRDASRIELRVLSTLKQNDSQNRNKCIHLRDCFDFRNHICITTDIYGQSVFDFLEGNNFIPFPNSNIQIFARQLFTSVAFLHDLNLIHTDLKPENILLVHNAYQTFTYNRTAPSSTTASSRNARQRRVLLNPEIRLIDFGSATFNDEYHSSVVSTRHYRAPEIILNLGWSFPCDIWSIGCILVEFFTGNALFQTHDNLEHLAMMEPVCDYKIDKELVAKVFGKEKVSKNAAASFFRANRTLHWPNKDTSRKSRSYVKAMKKLNETITPISEFNAQFLDLLQRIFVYDPDKRITAKEALRHAWFKEYSVDDGTEAAKIRQGRDNKKRAMEADYF